ncbi:bifunctional 2-C-methyl-D-erythritol 4-phosphate cytidylyltransferase/2-C-methyl-D-erythritol 2,4-cyclodiphosphate synthase [Dichotomicrobium thermohalophilum]|uniref:Bifunctional enzyme IspD/IspF n=1 Tax=Dichotomicrobium thermohalophilum TaxID=933063 RepID=A0A397Q623_9HYPH|nr:bifunctional 2-C-methyl-D-erythritol 4-phosphate cytidylyltransferase/2-C-methyl-D-erythritol 2,4-cyclodiphosphate synthase [Dichotomicrobium thermohalophilum]RIA56498.1 2-C-methyl-D-erythritol 2,4-cyclodiphosphate synthase [Dichotomicrobium thermohalophilum]
MTIAALIVAAGRGTRAATPGAPPKQYARLAGQMVLTRTLALFCAHPLVDRVLAVIAEEHRGWYEQAASGLPDRGKLLPPVAGGTERQSSVLNGLNALEDAAPEIVLVHDAARPLTPANVISRVIEGVETHGASIAAVPVADTLKRGQNELIEGTIDRTGLWRAQTPQGFAYKAIRNAHEAAAQRQVTFTDDASIAEWAGMRVALAMGSERNLKITSREDMALAESLIAQGAETRVGTGFDVHAFGPGDTVWLCGVPIPHERGLVGHSDADVGLHALTDAILGALAAGDIGAHFPPSDPQWRAAASHIFLERAADEVERRGGRIVNADVTLICEAPKIGPHRQAMRSAIAEILRVPVRRISVKATTSEKLGFTGRREGIAAMATASVAVPFSGDETC